ncbi:hypothetical protein HBI56_196630 [Parastagonospora nodorum]|nr:hypothetical protein HBH52_206850 [Parastagonospora nodorum]KAH4075331.1 hypothetical protein HBH50_014740 [Parastagonospora nodorum]KAH4098367.1 hypothetical protein HBH48_032610 [Parastagonospora nodorum]KAH4230859.1 hypothetical protein HBI05_186820 [Parastagonospora nodorum]KAH4244009.1 hypothetical protein HBI06_001350 [Parastagonospora nodorum]
MRFSKIFAASLVAPLVAAHGDIQGAPKLFGMKNLRARNPFAGHSHVGHAAGSQLQARQGGDVEGRCGPEVGGISCEDGFCCSTAGYCGVGKEYCAAPDCLIDFGPGCDANKTPYGASTAKDARPQLGDIEYGGVGIRECLNPKQVAITYDDGPYIYTEDVLKQFKKYNARATFFITGNNLGKGSIDENWGGVISQMYAEGHQIASHTWSHQNLDKITHEQRVDQMVKNEMAIRNIIGKYPTYMRPPYSACESAACQADMKALGYVVTSFDLDTDDYNQLTKEKIQVAKDNFKKGVDTAGVNGDALSISHDIHELTALNLTGYMLDYVYKAGWTAVTVGECMNEPVENWYRNSAPGVKPSASPSSSAPVPTPTGPTSIDGMCGSVSGQSCIGFNGPAGLSECCSPSGWCGNTDDYCGTGCNPKFGKCGPQPSAVASTTSAAPLPTVSLTTSTDGDCGYAAGKTCKGFALDGVKSECCSQHNYCGSSEDYCGQGCNPLYGNCGSSGSSSSVSISASASTSVSASDSHSESASSSSHVASSTSVSASASVSMTSVVDASASTSTSASRSDVSASQPAQSTTVPSTTSSASAAVSTHEVSSTPESKTSSASVHVSTSETASASATPSASVSASSVYPTTTADVHSTHTPDAASTSTPIASTPVSKDNTHPSTTATAVYSQGSTMSTIVRPISTSCTDDKKIPTPTPTGPPVSKDGKCGTANGGQTCAGYKDPFGQSVQCCCKESGKCSNDPWACGVGCDAKFGKCNKY